MKKTAIILARVSTAGQAEEELPIESQIEVSTKKAEQLGARVVKVFTEEGVSGRSLQRDVFDLAAEYCKANQVDYFILWNTARFARHRALAAWTKFNIRRFGTEMVYVSQNIDTTTDEGWMLEGLFELFDENQSRTISKDTRRSMTKNAMDGHFNGGKIPYGFTTQADGKRHRLAPHPIEAPVVREIFHQFIAGAGTKTIARAMNDAGRSRRGKPWDKDCINYMLKNEAYAGWMVYNRHNRSDKTIRPESEWIRTLAHEPIISQEVFMQAQEQFIERTPTRRQPGSPKSRFLFSGMLTCGICTQTMQIESASGRSKSYSYYNCRSALRGMGCKHRRLPARDVDQWLLGNVLDRILTPARIAEIVQQIHALKGTWVKDRELSRKGMVAELRQAETRRRKLYEVLELHGKDAPNLADIGPRLAELSDKIRSIEQLLTELESAEVPELELAADDLEEMAEYFRAIVERSEDPKKVRDFLATFIDRVEFKDGEAVIHYNPAKLVGKAEPGTGSGGGAVHSAAERHPKPPPYCEPVALVIQLPVKYRRAA